MKLDATDAHNLSKAVGLLKQAVELNHGHRGRLDAGFRLISGTAPTQLGFLNLALELSSPMRTVRPFSAAVHEVSWIVLDSAVHLYVRADLVHPDADSRLIEMRGAVGAKQRSTPGPVLMCYAPFPGLEVNRRKGGTKIATASARLAVIQMGAARPIGAVPHDIGGGHLAITKH